MATRRELILSRIAAVLSGAAGVGTRVYRSRIEPLTRGETPAIVIEPVADQAQGPDSGALGRIDWSLTVRVSVFVRDAVPDRAADATVADVHARLMADPSLAGSAMDMLPVGVSFDFADADQPAGVIALDYQVRYRTAYETL